MAVTTAVQFAAGTAKELQTRHRTNSFLDEMNEKIFKPRGLFALVMAFDPSSSKTVEHKQVNLAETIAKFDKNRRKEGESSFSMSRMQDSLKSIRVQSGTTQSEFEMPQAAALVFPRLDEELAHPSFNPSVENNDEALASKLKNRFKSASAYVADYYDRQAQAEYQYTEHNSSLAKSTPRPTFKSKLSDPAHPIHSGSIVALLSGGNLDPLTRRRGRRDAKMESRNARRVGKGKAPRAPRRERDALGQRKVKRKGIVSRILIQVRKVATGLNLQTLMRVECSLPLSNKLANYKRDARSAGSFGCSTAVLKAHFNIWLYLS
jgi:hypothetical protein